MVRTLPYGSWPSSISAEQLAVGGNRLGSPQWVGGQLWWSEGLAAEGGRQTIVRTVADPMAKYEHIMGPQQQRSPSRPGGPGHPDSPQPDGSPQPDVTHQYDDGAHPEQAIAAEAEPATVMVLPAPFNARSRVHEYGGACWIALTEAQLPPGLQSSTPDEGVEAAQTDSLVLFVNFTDQRIYSFRQGEEPRPITPSGPEVAEAGGPSLRWAQPTAVTLADGTPEVWWICEEHLGGLAADEAPRIERYIAAVPLDGSAAQDQMSLRKVTPSSRFIAHPRLSPDGTRLAWISWEHPQMPWDGTTLHLGKVAAGIVAEESILDGGTEVSVLQPEWRSESELVYLSDRSGWWNPWGVDLSGEHPAEPRQLRRDDQEYAGPLWQLGASWLTLLGADHALSIHGTATDSLGVLSLADGTVEPLELPQTSIAAVALRADGALALYGTSTTEFAAISVGRLERSPDSTTAKSTTAESTIAGQWRVDRLDVVRSSRQDAPDPALLPRPEPITVSDSSGESIHAVLYRPRQSGFAAPAGELPPYIAQVHGGPTGQAAVGLSLGIAYYTSRGIGVVDINYGGSTGFGRTYRDRLKGQWGVVDVADTVAVMEHLVNEGIADGTRLGIEGGSAGGWTTLACLTRTSTFAAGVSSFGVADLVALAEDTHDFESRYLDGLVGPYPEAAEIYRERAPLNHVDSLECPVLLLQGDEDPIVPPNQAEMFRDALAAKSIPHAYLLFAGEQHGFRKAENIITSFEASLSFYGQIFGFEPEGIPRLELTTGG